MMSNRFEGIKLEFEGLFYGGSYEIEIFSDGRFYYSFIENESIEIQRGCFQILQKEVMMFEELMEHFELLKKQGNYTVTEFRFNKVDFIQAIVSHLGRLELGLEVYNIF